MGTRTLLRTGLAAMLLLLAVPTFLAAQERQISGRVTRSGTTDPVPDVEISVLNVAEGRTTRTNADGRYSITAPAGDVRLQVRAIGYTRRQILVPAGTSTLDIVLVQDFFRLSEVVVTGQATTVERRSATTAIAYVSGEELSRVTAPTFETTHLRVDVSVSTLYSTTVRVYYALHLCCRRPAGNNWRASAAVPVISASRG